MLLALYRVAFPLATFAEINAFLYQANFGNIDFCFYSKLQIAEAESWIGLTKKRDSTTTYQVYLPINMIKQWMFWNCIYLHGIPNIWREDLIDLDEMG